MVAKKRTRKQQRHCDLVVSILKVGDVITHTRCGGEIEEHIYTGTDGRWLCGTATADTRLIAGMRAGEWTNDISPLNVTHINRMEVDGIPYAMDFLDRRGAIVRRLRNAKRRR